MKEAVIGMTKRIRLFIPLVMAFCFMFLFGVPQGSAASDLIPAEIIRYDFENGDLQGWTPRGQGVLISPVTAAAQSGAASLMTTNRTANWHGPSLNVNSIFKKGGVYMITGYVKLAAVPSTPSAIKFTVEQKPAGGKTDWKTVAQQTVAGAEWVKLSGTYSINQDMSDQVFYVESSDPNEAFYVDNVTIEMTVAPPERAIETDIPALKDVFADCFAIGAAVEPDQLTGVQSELLKKHFNSIVAENAMKPGSIQPMEGVFNWANPDRIVQFALDNRMEIRFHTLVWHQQVGEWFFKDPGGKDMTLETDPAKREANKKLLLQRLEKHITAIAERYKGKIKSWDVVNEVIDPSRPDGMRNSKWYQITGTDYIETAFRTLRKVAGPQAKLYINDYSTHDPVKRDLLYKLVEEMLAKGVPIDGVGHQMHINIDEPSIALIDQSIKLFAGLGLDNQITELDVSVYTNDTASYQQVPRELIDLQGHRYKELFDEFRRLQDYISNVTFWGFTDEHSWLHNRPIPRRDAPLPFDENYRAKPAYWGMVDPAKLPFLSQKLDIYKGTPVIDGLAERQWQILNWAPVNLGNGSLSAAFKVCWDERHLYVLADVKDASRNSGDSVEIFCDPDNGKTQTYQQGDAHYILRRGAKSSRDLVFKVKEYKGGYLLEASLPLAAGSIGQKLGFDIRVKDAGGKGAAVCWNDSTMSQDQDTSRYGTLTLNDAIKVSEAIQGTPQIDGVIDSDWARARVITTATNVMGTKLATAKVRTMWDEKYLYVLAEISDPVLNKANALPHEQDSFEIFIDENNGKSGSYAEDDAQYRVNFDNEQTFGPNGPESRFETATKIVEGGYLVEAAVPFKTIRGRKSLVIGFDVQVNEADAGGHRTGVNTWSDGVGNNYKDTSKFGVLILN